MKLTKHSFTLVELIVSMAVFALLSMMVVQLFSASQKLWTSNIQKNAVSAEGRTALNLIASLLANISAPPKVHEASSGSDVVHRGGDDYLRLTSDGPNGSSQLYFVTKTNHPGIKDSNSSVSTCFVGVQVVSISSANDPDYIEPRNDVLVMTVKTDTDDSFPFPDYFPQPDNSIKTGLDNQKANFSDGNPKISRIAACVVDFKVRLCNSSGDDIENPASGNTTRDLTAGSYPSAVELELSLMDKAHYELYLKASSNSERQSLRDQFARTFRKLVWLGHDRNEDDYADYNLTTTP
ncbi:MAG: type II secretion system GspH family protein [Victivallaceae bacterium]|nr:type II secretion system GspH family protein [Victivallaceae bacterium]